MLDELDVFLSHNSRDKPVVLEISVRLRERGLRVWLDQDELRPGFPWQEGLEEGVRASRAVAVFVGADGLGTWQEPEMRAFLARSKREKVPVIPVLLPGSPASPELPPFLEALTWVDLREGLTDGGLDRLAWGITGTKNEGIRAVSTDNHGNANPLDLSSSPTPRARWVWGAGLSLSVILTLGTWLWPRSSQSLLPERPTVYAVRVQVLDPQGLPIDGSTIHTSAGNEPQQTPDGWWEVEIPAAKAPASGQITLWAEHPEWEGTRKNLRLVDDPNVQIEIHLKKPETWLRGRVVDESNRPLSGARVFLRDGTLGESVTDTEGRFALKLQVPQDTRVRLGAVLDPWKPGDSFCYASRDGCSVTLEER